MLAWESGAGELVLLHRGPRQALSWAWASALSQVSAGHVTRCHLGTLQSGASPRQVGDGNELTGTTSTSGPLPSAGGTHGLLALRWAPVIRPVQKYSWSHVPEAQRGQVSCKFAQPQPCGQHSPCLSHSGIVLTHYGTPAPEPTSPKLLNYFPLVVEQRAKGSLLIFPETTIWLLVAQDPPLSQSQMPFMS